MLDRPIGASSVNQAAGPAPIAHLLRWHPDGDTAVDIAHVTNVPHVDTGDVALLIDARGAATRALTVLAAAPSARGLRLLLIDREDAALLDAFVRYGVSTFLVTPFTKVELDALLAIGDRTGAPDATILIAQRMADIEARGDKSPLALLLVQIDGIGRINERTGLAAGDALIIGVRQRIAAFAREHFGGAAHVARIEGPRFMLLPPAGTSLDDLRKLEWALHEALAPDQLDPTGRISPRVRAMTLSPSKSPGDALRDAGRGLARAAARRDAALLSNAIDQDELRIAYQPQYDMQSGKMVGCEALLRWEHPDLGLGSAGPIVAAAHASNHENELTMHILDRTLADVAAWPSELADLCLSVNITAADLRMPDFPLQVRRALDRHGVSADRVTLEITESAMLHNAELEQVVEQLGALHGIGVNIALDDFGTGYSSLSWLKQLPVDSLKIDTNLSRDIDAGSEGPSRARVVVHAIVNLARALNLKVVAEGVETEAQRAALALIGCDKWQGHLRSGAVDSATLARLAKRGG